MSTCHAEELLREVFEKEDRKKKGYVFISPRHSRLDSEGIDAVVVLYGYSFALPLQVKTSDTKETIGLHLPLLSPRLVITDYKREKLTEHVRKHPAVRYLLFVGRLKLSRGDPSSKSRPEILDDIWEEIQKMFLIASSFLRE